MGINGFFFGGDANEEQERGVEQGGDQGGEPGVENKRDRQQFQSNGDVVGVTQVTIRAVPNRGQVGNDQNAGVPA